MDTEKIKASARQAGIYGLAVVGFITLVMLGASLAVYMTRFAPRMADRIGAAAVSLSEIFVPASPTLSVVPTTPPALFFGTPTPETTLTPTPPPAPSMQPNWTAGTPSIVTNGTTAPSIPVTASYSGLPDLAVEIETVGYTAADGNIIATTTIPIHMQIAVKFKVTNIGTNVSGLWSMNISIPSDGMPKQQSFNIDSLVPTEPRGFIASFGNITPGYNRTIMITIDPNHQITESSIANNIATTSVTVLGN